MTVQVADTFNSGGRGSPNAWSPGSNGQNWTQTAGTATLGYNGSSNIGTLSGDTSTNVLTLSNKLYYFSTLVVSTGKTSSRASSIGLAARVVSSTTYYSATYASGTLTLAATVSGTTTTLGTYTFTETLGTSYSLKLQVAGQTTNTVSAKIWTNTEPSSFQISVTDTAIPVPGGVGVYGKGNSSSETLTYTAFSSSDPSSGYSSQLGSSPYGIGIYSSSGQQQLTEYIRDTVNAGYTWFRWQSTPWSAIETTQTNPPTYQFDASGLTAVIQQVNAAGLKFDLVVRKPPTWWMINPCNNSTYVLMDAVAAATFAQALVNYYNLGGHGIIDCLEFGNEDYSKGWNNCPTGDVAANLMNHVYPAVKSLDSSILVGPPATYMEPRNVAWWYAAFFTAGGGNSVDFINVHSYPCGIGPNVPDSKFGNNTQVQLVQGVQTALNNAGYSSLPIWMTENAWAVGGSCGAPDYPTQSTWYNQQLDDMRSLYPGVQKHFWFDMGSITSGTDPNDVYHTAYAMLQQYVVTYPQWSTSPGLAVSPASLSYTANVGVNPANQFLTLTNTSNSSGSWATSISYGAGSGWLALAPASGSLGSGAQQVVTASVTSSSLAAGTYTATITWTMGANTVTTPVTLVVSTATTFTASPTALTYSATISGGNPASQTVTLTNNSGATGTWTESITYGTGGTNWLTCTPTHGSLGGNGGTGTVKVAASIAGLGLGTFYATITWTLSGAYQATTVVSLTISSSGGVSLITFSPGTTMVSHDVNSNFTTLNTQSSLTIPFVTFSSDSNLIQSDGNGNLVWNGGLGHGTFLDLYDGTTTTVTIKNTLPTGTIHFQVPSGTDIATINSTEWTLATGGIFLSTGSLSRTSTFTGTGSGVYNHQNGGTPNVVMPVCDVPGYERVEYDSPGNSQVNINVDGGFGFWCFCEGF